MDTIHDGMRYPSIDQLITKAQSKYILVVGTAKRARAISKGARVLIKNPHSKKSIGIALEEIYLGKVIIKTQEIDMNDVNITDKQNS